MKIYKNLRIVQAEMILDTDIRHEWIIAGRRLIDITGDQFEGGPAIVCGRRSIWHEMEFDVINTSKFNPDFLDKFHEEAAEEFERFYEQFKFAFLQLK
jgi:hypothetical protein